MHPQEQESDAALMCRLAGGDDTAFDVLMQRYKTPVLNFLHRILNNQSDAEDASQDAFVRIYQHCHDYDPARSFTTWLFAIARNAALDRVRWRQRHPADPLDDLARTPETNEPSPPDIVAQREIEQQIAAAIATLPEDQRTAIVLSEYHDLSHADIAAVMKCSEKSVESRIYRARQTLRHRLQHLFSC
jgi:RNA polymerase sigma-70 factor (ECF subfamily)